MANAKEHQLVSGLTVWLAFYLEEGSRAEMTLSPYLAGTLGAMLASLPDKLEPATNPNHRQFFHSVLFAGMLSALAVEVYRWRPDNPLRKVIRYSLLAAIIAYLAHLGLDALTKKSLPILGRVG